MSAKKTLRQILEETKECFLVPCVYDCASNRAVEMCGFPVSLLSGGEVSISLNGVIDYGFTNLTDLEWVVSRVSTTSSIPLICDVEDGFGGPLAVYRSCKRLAAAGAAALQLEDSADMEESTKILPRDKYLAKIRAAVEALKGTDCLLIARTNADPSDPEEFREGMDRVREAMELGADMAMMVLVSSYEDAKTMAENVPGWKILADVRADNGVPNLTMKQLTDLGFSMCSTHYTMKAAMEGMLEHGLQNFKDQSVAYTFSHASGTGQPDYSASPLFEPQAYLELENEFTGNDKEYTIVGHKVDGYPEGFKRIDIKDRL
ncbi:isocitrate lyase/PEP mutase family protein [Spirochaeta cellobiosiphila]|uniref:isocitrate lyase/PEP mutase family protein n=1 Tax=Spirochaeta cellobiosiphila TaxID=504483 RepID=UPI0003FDE7AE|nr:isocitrate lyase/PEP mutase family protein [Spirochaeta cellobiosiphila]